MAEQGKEKQILDILVSLALYKAREAGLIKGDVSNREIGVLGGAQADALRIFQALKSGEISVEEAENAIRRIVYSTLTAPADVISTHIKAAISNRIPVLAPIIDSTVDLVKEKVAEKVADFVGSLVNRGLRILRGFFS